MLTDYTLTDGSNAIGAAVDTTELGALVATDYWGEDRPYVGDGLYDIGADESTFDASSTVLLLRDVRYAGGMSGMDIEGILATEGIDYDVAGSGFIDANSDLSQYDKIIVIATFQSTAFYTALQANIGWLEA